MDNVFLMDGKAYNVEVEKDSGAQLCGHGYGAVRANSGLLHGPGHHRDFLQLHNENLPKDE